jgi:hypothetical protein
LGLTVHANPPRTSKLWAIVHENGHKTQKRWLFGHNSKTRTGCYMPCKYPWNPETVGHSSWNSHKMPKTTSFWSYLSYLYRVLWAIQIPLEPKNYRKWLMKTAIKHRTDEFLVMLPNISGLTCHANPHSIPQLWGIAHENGYKTRKWRFYGQNSQTCIGSYEPCKSPWNPKIEVNSSWKRS